MYSYTGKVVKVVDGDTFDILIDLGFGISVKHRFRLYGVDTPETYGKNACEEGKVVKKYVKELLKKNSTVYIETYKDKKGKYGRYLADVYYIDKLGLRTNLAEHLINKGYAKFYE